jgi:hypothetical protein
LLFVPFFPSLPACHELLSTGSRTTCTYHSPVSCSLMLVWARSSHSSTSLFYFPCSFKPTHSLRGMWESVKAIQYYIMEDWRGVRQNPLWHLEAKSYSPHWLHMERKDVYARSSLCFFPSLIFSCISFRQHERKTRHTIKKKVFEFWLLCQENLLIESKEHVVTELITYNWILIYWKIE